jgi:hypothetical protein
MNVLMLMGKWLKLKLFLISFLWIVTSPGKLLLRIAIITIKERVLVMG